MKKAAMFFSGWVLSALACAPAMAEAVRVSITARVSEVNDYGGVLNNKIIVGQRLTGTYVYNTNTPNVSQDPWFTGEYHPFANEGRVRLAAGGFVFESQQPTQGIVIQIQPQREAGGQFFYVSRDNKPLSNGAGIWEIIVRLAGTGAVTQSDALPAVAPDLSGYSMKDVLINGVDFQVTARIESAQLIVPEALEVSPASGNFVIGQQFDAALILPRNSSVVSAHARANGAPFPFNYPGACTLRTPQSSQGKPALLCQGVGSVLPHANGAPIEWTVELSNGTVLTKTVNWTLAE